MNIPVQLKSRKLWLTVTGIVSTLGAWFTNEMTAAQAITALVALITGYNAVNGLVEGKHAHADAIRASLEVESPSGETVDNSDSAQ